MERYRSDEQFRLDVLRRNRLWRSKHKVAIAATRKISSAKYRLLAKTTAINKLGGKCACCGETELKFLSVDHIKGDGRLDRARFNNHYTFYWSIVKDRQAKSKYRVLCFNCNFAIGHYGQCPHRPSVKAVLRRRESCNA